MCDHHLYSCIRLHSLQVYKPITYIIIHTLTLYPGEIRIWDSSGKRLLLLKEHTGPVFSLKWNKTGMYMYTFCRYSVYTPFVLSMQIRQVLCVALVPVPPLFNQPINRYRYIPIPYRCLSPQW